MGEGGGGGGVSPDSSYSALHAARLIVKLSCRVGPVCLCHRDEYDALFCPWLVCWFCCDIPFLFLLAMNERT